MTRRQQKMSPAKAKTAWLAWCAWGFLGGIFVFEDTLGGRGAFCSLAVFVAVAAQSQGRLACGNG